MQASVFIYSQYRRVLKGERTGKSMLRNAPSLLRGICFSATLYAGLFFAHIIAAAQDWDLAFTLVAGSITLLTFIIGPCIIMFGRVVVLKEKRVANSTGHAISLLLAVALAWAYADQSIDITLTLSFLFITSLVHLYHRRLLNQMHAEKMG
tara:strand:+ start:13058 stop:13510 length:453 start_codon:yes stop_codon:yes gene_type:complete